MADSVITDRDRAKAALHAAGLNPEDHLTITTEEEAREFVHGHEEAERIVRDELAGEQEERDYQRAPERRAEEHEGHVRKARAIRTNLAAERDRKLTDAYEEVKGRERQRLGKDADGFRGKLRSWEEHGVLDEQLAEVEREHRKAAKGIRVTLDPPPYSKGSPHSWVRDVLCLRGQEVQSTAGSRMDPASVRERLTHHGKDISVAIRERSKYGERAAAIIHESLRCEDEVQHRRKASEWRREELRAFGTDGGSSATSPGEAASFVPPNILLKAWAGYRTPYASFANQCKQEDMPEYGLNLYVPHVTGATEVTSQTEGSEVATKAPTAGLIKGAVVNKAGGVEVSQQFLDRVGPGIAGDAVLFAQLKMEIDTAVDSYAITQTLTEAQTVINNTAAFAFGESSGGVGGFLNDVRKGKNLVATTSGTRLKATHLFAPSKVTNFLEAWGTTIGGPVWSPTLDDNRLPIRSEGDALGEGYSGYVLSQLAIFSDDDLPKLGTTATYELVVADPMTVLLFRSEPVFAVSPETYSTTLDAELTARVYTACVPRWPEGAAVLTGLMYKESLFA